MKKSDKYIDSICQITEPSKIFLLLKLICRFETTDFHILSLKLMDLFSLHRSVINQIIPIQTQHISKQYLDNEAGP